MTPVWDLEKITRDLCDADDDSAFINLMRAAKMVTHDRQEQHGDPAVNLRNIGDLWTMYLDTPINSKDVAIMMVLLKVARTQSGEHNPDDYVDMCGYAAIAGQLAAGQRA